jgi:hypothetical protein
VERVGDNPGELRSAGARRTQQVTCKMALVSGGFCFSSSMACSVGTMNNSTSRRLASTCTSLITGKAPVPVPTTRRRHFHGIPSSSDRGVCPKASRNFGRFLLPLAYLATVDHDVVVVADPIDPNGAKGESVESHNVPPMKISVFRCADVAAPQL